MILQKISTIKVLKNLGASVSMVQDFNDNGVVGYEILYEMGDKCMEEQQYSTLVKMVCFPSSEDPSSPTIR